MADGRQQLPGNVRIRRRRLRREVVTLRRRRRAIRFQPRLWMVPGLFASGIAIGALLLMLPIASESGDWTNGVDSLFTSASAVCVTGLIRFDTADHWNWFGELVIAVLVQASGLGITMYAGAMLLAVGSRFGLSGREFFGMELMEAGERDIQRLLRRVLVFALAIEFSTFVLLLPWFVIHEQEAAGIWKSAFQAISSFNNAGFDLQGGLRGFTGEADDPYPLAVMSLSAFLGSLSFITVFNMRNPVRLWSLDTRLVVIGMASLLVAGIALFLVVETRDGHVLDGQNPVDAFVNAVFMSVNRTTGMSTVDLARIEDATIAALLLLMFIGGASTSTAGGIKMGAFMVSMVAVLSALRGRHRAAAFGREVPQAIVLRALAVTILGFFTLGAGIWLLELTDDVPFLPLMFEVMSALANVGWSQGITGELSEGGALILVALMFVGRLGPLYVALSIPDRAQTRYRFPDSGVRIG
jgi:trk system potassium uptake protein TrkH